MNRRGRGRGGGSSSSKVPPGKRAYSEDEMGKKIRHETAEIMRFLHEHGADPQVENRAVRLNKEHWVFWFERFPEVEILPEEVYKFDTIDVELPDKSVRVAGYNLTTETGRRKAGKDLFGYKDEDMEGGNYPGVRVLIRNNYASYLLNLAFLNGFLKKCVTSKRERWAMLAYLNSSGRNSLRVKPMGVELIKLIEHNPIIVLLPLLPGETLTDAEKQAGDVLAARKEAALAERLNRLKLKTEFEIKEKNPMLESAPRLKKPHPSANLPYLRKWFKWRDPTNWISIMYPSHFLCQETHQRVMGCRSHRHQERVNGMELMLDNGLAWCPAMTAITGLDKKELYSQQMDGGGGKPRLFEERRIPHMIYYDQPDDVRSMVFLESLEEKTEFRMFHWFVPQTEFHTTFGNVEEQERDSGSSNGTKST